MSKIQEEFDSLFSEYRDVPIAIYGTGNNARLILENILGYQFSNLVSKECIGDTLCGKKIVSLQDAINTSQMLIIAAVPASTAIIYQRIKELVPEDYPIYDMRGNRLSGNEQYRKNPYWESNADQLRDIIRQRDIVSFDVFDTLITRTVLEPRDVFRVVEEKMRAEGMVIPFYEWRLNAENECNKNIVAPSIEQIYAVLREEYGLGNAVVERAMCLEVETELEVIRPRKVMKDILEWTISLGKTVYLTSDMYFSKSVIKRILSKAGIEVNVPVLISSEYGKSKKDGSLYEVLLERTHGASVLHIGDSFEIDVMKAKQYGIEAFYVKRGFELFAESSYGFLLDNIISDDDRKLLGVFVAEMGNNPFVLCEAKGKFCIDDYRKIAWCLAPITILFMSEIVKNAYKYDKILFAARDGFFLNQLYSDITKDNIGKLAEGEYFYVSRSAVSSASVFGIDDIQVFSNKVKEDTKLNLKKFMLTQFHVEVPDMYDISMEEFFSKWGEEEIDKFFESYESVILEKSAKCRENYWKYFQNIGVDSAKKIAIVDTITQGTLIYGISNMLKKKVDLLAVGTIGIPNKYIDDVTRATTIFGNVCEKVGNKVYSFSDFCELHPFLEMLYGSTEGQLFEFSDSGTPLTLQGTEYNAKLIDNTQAELLNIIYEYSDKYYERKISKEFALAALELVYNKYSDKTEDIIMQFEFEDPYNGNMQKYNLVEFLSK